MHLSCAILNLPLGKDIEVVTWLTPRVKPLQRMAFLFSTGDTHGIGPSYLPA